MYFKVVLMHANILLISAIASLGLIAYIIMIIYCYTYITGEIEWLIYPIYEYTNCVYIRNYLMQNESKDQIFFIPNILSNLNDKLSI